MHNWAGSRQNMLRCSPYAQNDDFTKMAYIPSLPIIQGCSNSVDTLTPQLPRALQHTSGRQKIPWKSRPQIPCKSLIHIIIYINPWYLYDIYVVQVDSSTFNSEYLGVGECLWKTLNASKVFISSEQLLLHDACHISRILSTGLRNAPVFLFSPTSPHCEARRWLKTRPRGEP